MEYNGAERGAAHARVRDSNHVLDALTPELPRDGQVARLWHAGRAFRTRVAEHQHVVRPNLQIRIINAPGHVGDGVEDDGSPGMLQKSWSRGTVLDHGSARGQVTAQNGHGADRLDGVGGRADDSLPWHILSGSHNLPQGSARDRPGVEVNQIT